MRSMVRRCEGARVRRSEVADRGEPGEGPVITRVRCCGQKDERPRAVREDGRDRRPIGSTGERMRFVEDEDVPDQPFERPHDLRSLDVVE